MTSLKKGWFSIMNLEKFLSSTLQAIDKMPIERFEEICIEHGYNPERKINFSHKMSTKSNEFCLEINKKHKLVHFYEDNASNDGTFDINDGNFSAAA